MRLYYDYTGRIQHAIPSSEVGLFTQGGGYSIYEVDECPENSQLCYELKIFSGIDGSTGVPKYFIQADQLNVVDNWRPFIPVIPNFVPQD